MTYTFFRHIVLLSGLVFSLNQANASLIEVTLGFNSPADGGTSDSCEHKIVCGYPTLFSNGTVSVDAIGSIENGYDDIGERLRPEIPSTGNTLRTDSTGRISISGGIGTSVSFAYGGGIGGFSAKLNTPGAVFTDIRDDEDIVGGTHSFSGQYFNYMDFGDPISKVANVDDVKLGIIPIEDVLKNSVRIITPKIGQNSIEIEAEFQPRGPWGIVPIDILTNAMGIEGFVGFNWLQTMSGPGNWEWQIWKEVKWEEDRRGNPEGPVYNISSLVNYKNFTYEGSNKPIDREIVTSPVIDVIQQNDPEGKNKTYFVRVDGNSLNDVRYFGIPQDWADSEVFYWNTSFISQASPYYNFYDAPRTPSWAFSGPNHYMSFTTELVGMVVDRASPDSYKTIRFSESIPGLKFTWKSNITYEDYGDYECCLGRISHIGITHPYPGLVMPQVISGSIFDVQFVETTPGSFVPEPASLALLGLGLAGMGFARRRRV